jgi:hypothetical protein
MGIMSMTIAVLGAFVLGAPAVSQSRLELELVSDSIWGHTELTLIRH